MDIKEMLINTKIQNELTINLENDVIFVIELLKGRNDEELLEEKIINFALRKLFLELGLLDGETTENTIILNSNHVRIYINENIVFDEKGHEIADKLFEHYYDWSKKNKYTPLTKQFFYKEMINIGAVRRRTSKGYKFNGISLIK